MQIICNHCGTRIDFSDYQYQVTCPSCYTHLQIEEEKDRIVATIIKERDFDDTIFQQKQLPADLQNFGDLFDLMRLEAEYDEVMQDNFAKSLTVGEKFRPMLLRGLYRASFGGILALSLLSNLSGDEDVWSRFFVSLLFILYGLFLFKIGVKETIKWFRLWRFEKEYMKDKAIIMERLHFSIRELPNVLKRNFADFEDNEKHSEAIKKEFFYIKIFNKLRIYVGAPSVSKALRMFAILIPTGLISIFLIFESHLLSLIYLAFAVMMTFFAFFIMGDSSTYQEEQVKYWQKRERQLDKFKHYF